MTYFLNDHVTAIYGRPASYQQFLAEEVAFAVASGLPLFGDTSPAMHATGNSARVAILTDSATGTLSLLNKFKSWGRARGFDPGEQPGITPIDTSALVRERSFSAALFAGLKERGIKPALIVSAHASTAPQGFGDYDAQAELAMAKQAVNKLGCAVLLAGHTGPAANQSHVDHLAANTDSQWVATVASGGADHTLTLTQGDAAIKLAGRNIGGNGLVPTIIFDVVKAGGRTNG